MNVGERLAEILVAGGAKALFGVPGGQTLPLYGAAPAAGLNHVVGRQNSIRPGNWADPRPSMA